MNLKDIAAGLGVDPSQAQAAVDTILAGLGGSGPRSLLDDLAAQIGVDPGQLQQLLPQVLDLLSHLELSDVDGLIDQAAGLFTGLLDGGNG